MDRTSKEYQAKARAFDRQMKAYEDQYGPKYAHWFLLCQTYMNLTGASSYEEVAKLSAKMAFHVESPYSLADIVKGDEEILLDLASKWLDLECNKIIEKGVHAK